MFTYGFLFCFALKIVRFYYRVTLTYFLRIVHRKLRKLASFCISYFFVLFILLIMLKGPIMYVCVCVCVCMIRSCLHPCVSVFLHVLFAFMESKLVVQMFVHFRFGCTFKIVQYFQVALKNDHDKLTSSCSLYYYA